MKVAGLLCWSLLALTFGWCERGLAQNSAFTYQGRLTDKGRAALGTYDFQFRLCDGATNGNFIGPRLNLAGVSVTNGFFTVTLDFGPVFDGSPRFLETGVKTNGSDLDYTVLQPRQAITMAPYAMLANSALAAGVASNLVAGAVLTNLSIAGSAIIPGTISASQMDPATDALYRGLDTNAILGLISQVVFSNPGGATRYANVKLAFGATGDGVADDTAALQSALDSLADPAATNRALYLPPGTYRLTAPLRLPANDFPLDPVTGLNTGWRISGAGRTVTRLVWAGAKNDLGLTLSSVPGNEGVIVEDLALIGPQITSWDPSDTSIGLVFGRYGAAESWSGFDNLVRNCAILGWGYGAAATNQWGLVFDNCVIASNSYEGLRFVGTHNVSVQNCRITGGWSTACGIGVGFHAPLNAGYGDNAQLMNCLISNCTNGILNQELNLLSLNNHLEACGSYYTLFTTPGASSPATTILGGYTLDFPLPWTNGFGAQLLMDAATASQTLVANCWFTSALTTQRPVFNVTNQNWGFALPSFLGQYSVPGLWNTTSNLLLNPVGATPQWFPANQTEAASRSLQSLAQPLRSTAIFPSSHTRTGLRPAQR